SDEQCPQGQICKSDDSTLITAPGTCVVGCDDDSQCDQGSRCICQGCYVNGCVSNDDCGEGTFCPIDFSLVCVPTTCVPLPLPVTCGTTTCPSIPVRIVLGSSALAACCPSDNPGVCGFDVSSLGTRANRMGCQAPSTAGSSDPECPTVSLG